MSRNWKRIPGTVVPGNVSIFLKRLLDSWKSSCGGKKGQQRCAVKPDFSIHSFGEERAALFLDAIRYCLMPLALISSGTKINCPMTHRFKRRGDIGFLFQKY